MKGISSHGAMISALLACLAGCASVELREVRLGDGRRIRHPYRNGIPEPAANAWAKVEVAGVVLLRGQDPDPRPHYVEAFALTLRRKGIAEVRVFDVSGTPVELELDKAHSKFKADRWVGATPRRSVTREHMPWLFEQGDTERVFKFVLRDTDGKSLELLQPSVVTDRWKTDSLEQLDWMLTLDRIRRQNPAGKVELSGPDSAVIGVPAK